MKRIIELTIAIIMLMFFISGCDVKLNYRENVLYSEKDLSNYKSSERYTGLNDNLMTRQEAIDKGREVFKEGLNIDLSQMQVSEYVRLFKQSNEGYFNWNIYWNKDEGGIVYSCDIDSATGEVVRINAREYEEQKKIEAKYSTTSNETVHNIISPLMTSLKIDIEEYELINALDVNSIYMNGEVYKSYEFKNINNKEDRFMVTIDWSGDKVLGYEKIMYKEDKINY